MPNRPARNPDSAPVAIKSNASSISSERSAPPKMILALQIPEIVARDLDRRNGRQRGRACNHGKSPCRPKLVLATREHGAVQQQSRQGEDERTDEPDDLARESRGGTHGRTGS